MITNAREYQTTKSQLARLEDALTGARASPLPEGIHPAIRQAELRALESEIDSLRKQIEAYDALREGRLSTLNAVELAALPEVLIQSRIAANLTQRELAEKLGLKEQQLQRYEATRYRGVSFDRLLEVAHALGVRIQQSVTLPSPSPRALVSRLQKLGISSDFLERRILPIGTDSRSLESAEWFASAKRIENAFGVPPAALTSPAAIYFPPQATGGALMKLPRGRRPDFVTAYTAYAYSVARGAAESARHLPKHRVPQDCLAAVRALGKPVTLRRIIDWAWSLGVVVIPLPDRAAFAAAFWRIDGRNVVILKNRTAHSAIVMHDLLHELFHASQEPDLPTRSIIEPESEPADSEGEEEHASRYATEVLLDCRADDLALKCAHLAAHQVPRMKSATERVAAEEAVPVGALARYVAHVLKHQPRGAVDWWKTAATLQTPCAGELSYAADLCFANLRPPSESLDAELLFRALRDQEIPDAQGT